MSVRTVKVSNVSLGASEQDIKEYFSFSGEIEYVEMQSENERAQTAFVTFKDLQGTETAVLLSFQGATIVDQSVTIALAPDYKLPPTASATPPGAENQNTAGAGSAVQKSVDVVSSMLAKGFILGKDAVNKAKSFDEKMRLTSTATAIIASLDQKIGLSEKINMGTTIMNDKVKEMDQKFQVSEKTKSAIAAAEQTVSSAGSAIMKNRYVLTGTPWVTGAFNKVTKAGAGSAVQKAEDVVSSMLAKGFILGKDAVNKAKSFDEKMRLTSTATATVASLDQKIGLSEKINMGTTIMNDKVKEMDQKFQVSEKTKSAIAAAEQTVSSAGSAIMKNRYVLTGTPWVTGAFNKVTKAGAGSAVQKAEDVVSSMLAKGFILGKDAVNKAKSFDEKMRLTSTATATVASLDQKIGLSEKINMGTTIMNDKVKEMYQKFQVSEKTKSAIAAAEQTVSSAGSAIMKNRYVLTGTPWVTGAFNKVTKAGAGSAVQKAEDVVSSMLAKGFILGKDAVNKAKSFDEKMRLTSTATATVASLDQKIGLSEKINMGTTIMNDKVKEMDQKFQVSEKTKSAIAAAEQTVSSAGSAIMKNRYVLTGTSWVTGAFNKVSKAAGEVGQKTKEKMTEEEHGRNVAQGYAQVHDPDSKSEQPSAKPGPVQGLIL